MKFLLDSFVTVRDYVSNEGGYTLGHRKFRNLFLRENDWNICKLTLTSIREISQYLTK